VRVVTSSLIDDCLSIHAHSRKCCLNGKRASEWHFLVVLGCNQKERRGFLSHQLRIGRSAARDDDCCLQLCPSLPLESSLGRKFASARETPDANLCWVHTILGSILPQPDGCLNEIPSTSTIVDRDSHISPAGKLHCHICLARLISSEAVHCDDGWPRRSSRGMIVDVCLLNALRAKRNIQLRQDIR